MFNAKIYEYSPNGLKVVQVKGWTDIELWYPSINDEAENFGVEIELMHVRAADSIRVLYDGKRDGWSILQASIFEWPDMETAHAPNSEDWQEVAFIPAWQRRDERIKAIDPLSLRSKRV